MKLQNLINDWLQNNSSLLEWFGIYIPIFVLLIAGVYLIFLVGEIYKSKTGPIFKIIGVYSIRLALHILILNIIFYKISEFHQVRNELLILLIGIYIIFDPLSIIILFIKNIKLLIQIQKNGECKESVKYLKHAYTILIKHYKSKTYKTIHFFLWFNITLIILSITVKFFETFQITIFEQNVILFSGILIYIKYKLNQLIKSL